MKPFVISYKQFNEARSVEKTGSWYYGIADCHGVESFIKEPDRQGWNDHDELNKMGLVDTDSRSLADRQKVDKEIQMMALRCQFNQQRHPVVYRVKLTDEVAELVESYIEDGDYVMALTTIKDHAIEVQLAKGTGGGGEKRWNKIPNPELDAMSEGLKYHIDNNISITESIYRPASEAHFELLSEARKRFELNELTLTGIDKQLFEETDLGRFGEYDGEIVPLDFLFEAEYHGKNVELGKPMRGGTKKYHVYVMNPKTKKVKKIAFGDVHGGLTAKVSNPTARKSFAARHKCHLKNDKLTAGYWACRINRYAHLWGGKVYPGFW